MKHRRFHSLTSILAFLVLSSIIGLFVLFLRRGQDGTPSLPREGNANHGWVSVYFTNPSDPSITTYDDGPDVYLMKAIDEAQYTIDIAAYRLDLWSICNALIRAHNRGVIVRVITESNHRLEPEIADLESAGIPIMDDRRRHLMHHKFVIIDRVEIWTGSMNLTVSGAYFNHNNLIRIRSNRISQNFAREFDEMFIEDRFGALSRADTPFPSVVLNGTLIETYFSPEDDIAGRIIALLGDARESIHFLAFSFTSDEIAEAMLERAQSGTTVRGVIEASQTQLAGSEFDRLNQSGLDVRSDNDHGIMHHKVIIIDGKIVITGSYNFSRSAEEQNDENILILHDVELAQQYLVEFERIFQTTMP